MNSHNHAMFSGAANTLMTRIGGIRPAAPGFAKIEIRPTFPNALDWAEASRETPHGRVAVAWKRINGSITLDVTVPPFTPAVLHLPSEPARPLSSGRQQVFLKQ
jgi:alpha-L-rhamnosidase